MNVERILGMEPARHPVAARSAAAALPPRHAGGVREPRPGDCASAMRGIAGAPGSPWSPGLPESPHAPESPANPGPADVPEAWRPSGAPGVRPPMDTCPIDLAAARPGAPAPRPPATANERGVAAGPRRGRCFGGVASWTLLSLATLGMGTALLVVRGVLLGVNPTPSPDEASNEQGLLGTGIIFIIGGTLVGLYPLTTCMTRALARPC